MQFSLTTCQIHLYTQRIYPDDGVLGPLCYTSRNVEEICQFDPVHILLPQPVHTPPLDRNGLDLCRGHSVHRDGPCSRVDASQEGGSKPTRRLNECLGGRKVCM